jgi:hypothetical protein
VPDGDNALTDAQQLVLNYVRRIARIAQAGALLAIAVILVRATGQGEISVAGTKIPLSGVWPLVVFAGFTAAHVYWTWYALEMMDEVRRQTDSEERGQELLRLVRTDTGWFLGGLMPRTDRIGPDSRVVHMDLRDPTTLISCGLALLVFVACLPWTVTKQDLALEGGTAHVIVFTVAAFAVVTINWSAASTWIVTLSQLGLPPALQWATEDVWVVSAPIEQWRLTQSRLRTWAIVVAVVLTPLVLIFAS